MSDAVLVQVIIDTAITHGSSFFLHDNHNLCCSLPSNQVVHVELHLINIFWYLVKSNRLWS